MRKLKVSEIRDFKPCKGAWEFFLKYSKLKPEDEILYFSLYGFYDSLGGIYDYWL